jgi:hypothetical protein
MYHCCRTSSEFVTVHTSNPQRCTCQTLKGVHASNLGCARRPEHGVHRTLEGTRRGSGVSCIHIDAAQGILCDVLHTCQRSWVSWRPVCMSNGMALGCPGWVWALTCPRWASRVRCPRAHLSSLENAAVVVQHVHACRGRVSRLESVHEASGVSIAGDGCQQR